MVRKEAQISKYFQKKLNLNWYDCKIFCIDKTMHFKKIHLQTVQGGVNIRKELAFNSWIYYWFGDMIQFEYFIGAYPGLF